MTIELADGNPGNETRNSRGGRPARHADAAARKRSHREGVARFDFSDTPRIKSTVAEIALELGVSESEVMRSMLRFALTNRNWKQVGLYGAKGMQ